MFDSTGMHGRIIEIIDNGHVSVKWDNSPVLTEYSVGENDGQLAWEPNFGGWYELP